MNDALAGLVVVDAATGTAGPVAAMFFADAGADVVRVVSIDDDGHEPAARMWHRGKRWGRSEDTAALVAEADVCIVSTTDAERAGTPLDSELACATNGRLVLLATPPYLGTGTPWAGGRESDALLAASVGASLRQASVEDVPVDSIYPHLVTVQGVWAAAAAVAALVERERSGLGQRVVVGGLHGAMVASAAACNFDGAAVEAVSGARRGGSGGAVPFYRTYRCGDGEWLFLAALTPRFTQLAFETLGVAALFDDERLEGRGRAAMLLPEHAGWVIDAIAAVFASRPRQEWLDALRAAGCPAGPLLARDDWLDHPQLAAIGMRHELDGVVMPGHPIQGDTTGTSGRNQLTPASGAPASSRHVSGASSIGAANHQQGPLDGVRVLDLGAIIAGPFGASLLAELGADVIKVEPLAGDSFRGPGFAAYNKGQRGIALDLQHPDGRQALLELVAEADVVIDNYRPGVLGRLRLRYEDLVAVNPAIITLSVTGFGEGGALGQEPGFDPVLQAMSGMMGAQGGTGDPVFFTVPVNDVTAAATSAVAVGLALFARARTGKGRRLWTSLAGMSALLQAGALVRYDGRPAPALGSTDHAGPAEDDRYHRAADGWVRVEGALADPEWSGMTRDEVVASLSRAGVAAAPARRMGELLDAVAGEEVFHTDSRPGRESWWTTGRHARFSRTERTDTLVAPSLGQHTREVLLEAGFTAVRVKQLIDDGIAGAR